MKVRNTLLIIAAILVIWIALDALTNNGKKQTSTTQNYSTPELYTASEAQLEAALKEVLTKPWVLDAGWKGNTPPLLHVLVQDDGSRMENKWASLDHLAESLCPFMDKHGLEETYIDIFDYDPYPGRQDLLDRPCAAVLIRPCYPAQATSRPFHPHRFRPARPRPSSLIARPPCARIPPGPL